MKDKLLTLIIGFFIGITNIIPGISGGTIAVVFNVYNRLINAVDMFTKHPLKALKSIWDILLGIALGLLFGFVFLSYTYELWPVAITLFFIGLLFGGLKPIIQKVKHNFNLVNIIVMVLSFAFIVALPLIPKRDGIDAGFVYFLILFILGIIATFAGFAPGISGSLMLMVFGYYGHVLGLGKVVFESFRLGNFSNLFKDLLPLIVLGLGIIVGFFVSVKTIKKILEKYEMPFYFSVFGMLLASPISIMVLLNENVELKTTAIGEWLIGALLVVIGFIISYMVIKLSENKEDKRSTRESEILTSSSAREEEINA